MMCIHVWKMPLIRMKQVRRYPRCHSPSVECSNSGAVEPYL
uniref:Uncharacterized protein n=1 Tax=Anguilla anguilla TaxID=7936 RepID=A0A0E9XVE7_ANGAN